MIRRIKGKNVSLYIHINSKIYDNQSIKEKENERGHVREENREFFVNVNSMPALLISTHNSYKSIQ